MRPLDAPLFAAPSGEVAAGLFAAALALFLPLLTLPLDASTSESGSEPETTTTEPETEMSAGCCVVVVDPFSTGDSDERGVYFLYCSLALYLEVGDHG